MIVIIKIFLYRRNDLVYNESYLQSSLLYIGIFSTAQYIDLQIYIMVIIKRGIHMNRQALIVVDVQEAMFFDPKELPFDYKKITENINLLIDRAHRSGAPVLFIRHTEPDGLFKQESDTWQVYHELHYRQGDILLQKTRWDSFQDTKLLDTLKKLSLSKLVFCGMQTEFCLDTTCRRAFSLGFDSILASDAHTTYDSKILKAKEIIAHHNSVIGGRFAKLAKAEEIDFS